MAKSVQAHDAGSLILGQLLGQLAEVLAPLLIVRLINKDGAGSLNELLFVHATLTMVLTTGLPAALSYHLAQHDVVAERRAIARQLTRLLYVMGAAAAFIYALAGGIALAVDSGAGAANMLALALLPLGDIPSRVLPNLLVVEGRGRSATWIGITRSLGNVACVSLPLALGGTITHVCLALSALGLVYATATLLIERAIYRGVPTIPSSLSLRRIIGFAFPMTLNELVGNLYSRLDRILIAVVASAATFADYAAGSWQVPIIPSIAGAVGVAYTPLFARLYHQGKKSEILATWRAQTVKTALPVVAIATFFLVAAEETIELAFTRDYLSATPVFRCFTFITLWRTTSFGAILLAAGAPHHILRASIVGLATNAIIGIPLYYIVGPIGPALASVIAFGATVTSYTRAIAKVTDAPHRAVYPWVGMLRVLAVAAAAAGPTLAFKMAVGDLHAGAKLGIELGIFAVAYAVLGTLFGVIERADWQFMGDWIRMRRRPANKPASTD